MANCVTKYYTKNTSKRKSFEEKSGVGVIVNMNDKVNWDFYSGGEYIGYNNGVPYAVGKWQCDGDENFTITGIVTKSDGTKKNQTYSSKTNLWVDVVTDTPAQLDPAFSCVTIGLTSMGLSFQIKDNVYVVATLKSGAKWFFYQTKPGVRPWVEVNNKTMSLNGTWSCLGESNFQLTRSDGKTYVGGDTSWKDETQPETTTEPTYDKTNFPLKKGSEGKEVIQLQNYLNKEIPTNPLVIDGIFGNLTHNKLVQVQKNKGVL
jgi:hypothetical protein